MGTWKNKASQLDGALIVQVWDDLHIKIIVISYNQL